MNFDDIKRGIQRARDPEIVMALLGIAQAIGISSALILADGPAADALTRILSILRGSTMGTALSFGLMGVAHSAPRMKAKQAQALAYAALVGLLVVSPVLIAPAVQANIPERILADPFARWLWSVAIAVAPDFVAIAVAVTSKAPAAESEPLAKPSEAERTEKPAKKPASKSLAFACSECSEKFKSQNALNAHKSKHKSEVTK